MNNLDYLFEKNVAWSKSVHEKDPDFFKKLSAQQAPEYLWIGCSDSRVPANQIVSLPPGEVFVHRNIANVVVHSDLNCISVIHYAVEVLKVKHIIVCGHYGCGGVHAAMDDHFHGLIDNWLCHIKDVSRFHKEELLALPKAERANRLVELNVMEQVKNVASTSVIQRAWQNNKDLTIHGWVYSLDNGIITDLKTSVSNNEEFTEKCGEAIKL